MDSENKRYTVVISDKATQMLISHARFLAQVSKNASTQLIKDLEVNTKSLEYFPERNPWLVDPLIPPEKYRKLLLGKRYLMIYQVKKKTIYVDAVVDTRQNYGWLL